MTGVADPHDAAAQVLSFPDSCTRWCIIKLGDMGAALFPRGGKPVWVPAFQVRLAVFLRYAKWVQVGPCQISHGWGRSALCSTVEQAVQRLVILCVPNSSQLDCICCLDA